MSDDSMVEEHKQTYNGFVRVIAVSTAATAVTLILMALFML